MPYKLIFPSTLRQLERQYGVKLCLDSDTEEKLVREAEETRMGVRYLRSRILITVMTEEIMTVFHGTLSDLHDTDHANVILCFLSQKIVFSYMFRYNMYRHSRL